MSARRIDAGSAVDRSRSLSFTYEGRTLEGYAGDTIASALLANGRRTVARSFKYHRPRGIWGIGAEEPNALFDVTLDGRTTPNLRATTEPLRDGIALRAINARPSAERDANAWLDRVGRFLPAGFYYKTFMWPSWHAYESRIRAMAGLGQVERDYWPEADCPRIALRCDTLVVGAGPAGLAAARAAARRGDKVLIVDDQEEPGGALRHRDGRIDDGTWQDWVQACLDDVAGRGGSVMARTTAYGVYDHGLVCAWRRGTPDALLQIRPGRTIVAAGAIERPLVFADNDRPGVMSADAALAYLRRFAVLVGERVLLATTNDSAYPVGEALAQAGAEVTVLDSRVDSPAMAATALKILRETLPEGVVGRNGVEAVAAGGRRIEADTLLVAGGWTPTVHLFRHAGGDLRFDENSAALVPDAPVGALRCAGAANGHFDLASVLSDGHFAGGGGGDAPAAAQETLRQQAVWPRPGTKGRCFVDLQNDVTLKDIELAAREGFRSVEHLKRYTTLGMATDQGKTSNMHGLAAMAAVTGKTIPETGTTTFRPPFVPVPFKIIAGRRRGELFNPPHRLALENVHRERGAALRIYGGWLRPSWYGDDGPTSVEREGRTARNAAAIYDASPLGKIEVMGPDAAAIMDYNSYNRLSTLKPGRIRYGLMLAESGIVYDDGVVMRHAHNHFTVSCSSAHVVGVRMRLEEWRQDRFDPARIQIHDATANWTTIAVTGPRARALIEEALPEFAPVLGGMRHMDVASAEFEGRRARLARVSFTGDWCCELSVPLSRGRALWSRLDEQLADFGGCHMGIETLMALRAEKGFIMIGKDTDGLTMPMDLGMEAPLRKRDDEYVGKRALMTPEAKRPDRRQLVGLVPEEGGAPLPCGAHVLNEARSAGFITSSHHSPVLDKQIALGLVEKGRSRIDESVILHHLGERLRARIVWPMFFDPKGERLDA